MEFLKQGPAGGPSCSCWLRLAHVLGRSRGGTGLEEGLGEEGLGTGTSGTGGCTGAELSDEGGAEEEGLGEEETTAALSSANEASKALMRSWVDRNFKSTGVGLNKY